MSQFCQREIRLGEISTGKGRKIGVIIVAHGVSMSEYLVFSVVQSVRTYVFHSAESDIDDVIVIFPTLVLFAYLLCYDFVR